MSSSIMVPVVATLMVVVLQTCSAQSVQNIRAQLGVDIILPCQFPSQKILIAVEWTRPDLTPELVLFYMVEHTFLEYQHLSFNNRVEMLDKEMKNGNAGLILRNVTGNDSGTYKCRVRVGWSKRNIESPPINIIRLTVTESGDTHDANEDEGYRVKHVGLIVGLFVVCLLVVVVVLAVIYLKRQRSHSSVPTNPEGPEQL